MRLSSDPVYKAICLDKVIIPCHTTIAESSKQQNVMMPPKNKLLSLQVYRALAAILVVLYHMGYYSLEMLNHVFLDDIFLFGYNGVDLFFVLSGFIIFFVHQKDIGQPHIFIQYLQKRLIRIYPLYWLVASAKLASLFLLPAIAVSSGSGLRYILYSFFLLPQEKVPIVGVAWTLSYELFFYFLFGTAILWGRRWALWSLGLWTAMILGYGLWRFFGLPPSSHEMIRFILNERNLEFVFGILIAYRITKSPLARGEYWVLAGIVLFWASGYYVNTHEGKPPFSFALTFGLASALIIAGSASVEMQKTITWPRWLIYLGNASYSIYLTHTLFINLWMMILIRTGIANLSGPFLASILVAILSIAGGCLTYTFVERPITHLLRSWFLEKRASPAPSPQNPVTTS
jgi:exopolysaccharide production protein ExoZ